MANNIISQKQNPDNVVINSLPMSDKLIEKLRHPETIVIRRRINSINIASTDWNTKPSAEAPQREMIQTNSPKIEDISDPKTDKQFVPPKPKVSALYNRNDVLSKIVSTPTDNATDKVKYIKPAVKREEIEIPVDYSVEGVDYGDYAGG